MIDATTRSLLEELGIDATYGTDPYRPAYTEPDALVEVEANVLGRMQQLTPLAAEAWLDMKAAASRDRVMLLIVSGFRSIAHQAELVQRKLSAGQPLARILEVSAAPGYSQHHTGETVDIATPGARPLTEAFESTDAYAWLCENAADFGFHMPYGRANARGFSFEPWHWTRIRD